MATALALAAPPPPPVASAVQLVVHARLHASPLNPRKHFDQASLAELAHSIEREGLLQNVVARPHPKKPGEYELAAGERRWRAVKLLVESGRRAEDAPIAVAVRELSDRQMVELGLAENVARSDLSPMEEADAYAKLVAQGVKTEDIARVAGRTQRHVQLRLDLVERLHPEAQAALRDGTIALTQARALTLGPAKLQKEVLGDVLRSAGREGMRDISADWVKRHMTRDLIDVAEAVFPLERYTGEIRVDPDDPSARYFADAAEFKRLQRAAIDAKIAELKKKWPKVVELDRQYGTALPWNWEKAKQGDKNAGAIVWIDKGRIVAHEGVVRNDDHAPARAANGKNSKPEMTLAFLAHCRHKKTMAIQAALAADPLAAKRALCAALIRADGEFTRLSIEWASVDDVAAPELIAAAKPFRAKLPALERFDAERPLSTLLAAKHDDATATALVEAVWKLPAAEIDKLLAVLAARLFGSFVGWRAKPGDDVAVAALAGALKIDMNKRDAVDAAFLDTCAKPQLLRIVHDLKLEHELHGKSGKPLGLWTGAQLRAALKERADKLKGYAPIWIRFGTEGELALLLKRDAKAVAELAAKGVAENAKGEKTNAKKKAKAKAEEKPKPGSASTPKPRTKA